MTRLRSIALALGLLAACKGGETKEDAPAANDAKSETETAPIPKNEAEFLAEVVPLPDGDSAIEVRYRIEQSSTESALTGEMTITIAAGGNRRDQWELRAGTEAAELRTTGQRIVTPDRVWIANEGAPGELSVNHLGALARAYSSLPEDARGPVIDSIRAWHRMLAEQRERNGAATDEVLGVRCLQTRVAAQNVCMWEETGLLLRYEGSAFRMEASSIVRNPELRPDMFELPAEAKNEAEVPSDEHDYEQILRDIADGSYGSVSLLLLAPKALPTLRVPKPAPTEPAPTEPAPEP